MSYRLYADLGNSRLKLAAVSKGRWLPLIVVSLDELFDGRGDMDLRIAQQLIKALDKQNLNKSDCEALVVAASSCEAQETIKHLAGALRTSSRILGQNLQAQLESRYQPPEALGSDRVANAVAAYAEYGGPVIVLDVGSCLTTEVVSAEGVFLGGHIAAGVPALYEGLYLLAPQLEQAELQEPPSATDALLGTSTAAAVRLGVELQLVGTAMMLVGSCRETLNDPAARVVLTGGDAEAICHGLNLPGAVLDPLLTLKGLRLIDEAANPLQ